MEKGENLRIKVGNILGINFLRYYVAWDSNLYYLLLLFTCMQQKLLVLLTTAVLITVIIGSYIYYIYSKKENNEIIEREETLKAVANIVIDGKLYTDATVNNSTTVYFTGKESTPIDKIVSFTWDFYSKSGDDSTIVATKEGMDVSYKYEEDGEYWVRLTVQHENGTTDKNRTTVRVGYYAEYSGEVRKGENKDYDFPVKEGVQKVIVIVSYQATTPVNSNDLNLSVYGTNKTNALDYSDEEYDPNAKGEIIEDVILEKQFAWEGGFGDWTAKVKCERAVVGKSVDFKLTIEVVY